MKIRGGFVSNSSSSSFTMIVDKDLHEKVLSILNHPYFNAVLSDCSGEDSAFGRKLVKISTTNGNYSTWEYEGVDFDDSEAGLPDEYDEWIEEFCYPEEGALDKYYSTLKELDPKEENFLTDSVDF
jgi:hypothetical protein